MTHRILQPLRILLAVLFMAAVEPVFSQQAVLPSPDELLEGEVELRRYTVELILFTYDSSVSAGTEVFVPDAPPPDLEDETSTFDPYPVDEAFDPTAETIEQRMQERGVNPAADDPEDEMIPVYGDMVLLPGPGNLAEEELEEVLGADSIDLKVMTPDELTMTDVHEKLLLLDAYKPVMWAGWTQVVREDAQTPAIRLRRLGNVPLEFDGDLKLYLSRFLHLVVDVSLEAQPASRAARPVREFTESRFGRDYTSADRRSDYGYRAPPIHYLIAEDRIIKSGDLRYFDHPKFGVLAKLSRFEEPEIIEFEDDGIPVPTGADGVAPPDPSAQ